VEALHLGFTSGTSTSYFGTGIKRKFRGSYNFCTITVTHTTHARGYGRF
jgi:hypothetical protein